MSLNPRRQSVRDARKTAFQTRKSNINSLAQFGISAPNDGSELFKKESKLEQLKRKSIFSVADFHADKFGCEEKLEAENEILETLPFVIHPYSVFRIVLDLTSALILFLNIYTIPMFISFPKFESIYSMIRPDTIHPYVTFWITIISDIWFTLEIICNFRTGYEEADVPILNVKLIRKRYMRGWFWLDLLATLPMDKIVAVFFNDVDVYAVDISGDITGTQKVAASDIVRYLKFIRLTKLTGVLRLMRLSRFFRSLTLYMEKILNADVAKGLIKIFMFIFVLLTWMHISACFQFAVTTFHPAFPHKSSWTTLQRLHVDQTSFSYQYINSIFRSLSHMFIGYGSLAPQNYHDMWAVFCSSFIGNLLKAAFIGIASSMMHMMAASKRLYNEKVASVMGYLEANKVPKELSQRVTNYYEKRYAGKMFDETKVLKILNPKLRMEIIRHNCAPLISGVSFLKTAPKNFVDEILPFMKLEMYMKDDAIVKIGQTGRSMYFISKGSVLVEMPDTADSKPFILKTGDFFGEISLLMPTVKRQATIIATDELYVYSLSYDDFQLIAGSYPREQARLLEVAKERLGDKYEELAKDFEEVLAEEAPVITTSTSENDFAPVHPIDPYADSGRLHNTERRSFSAGLMSTSETGLRRSQMKNKAPSRSQMSINNRISKHVMMPVVRESDDESEEEENFGW